MFILYVQEHLMANSFFTFFAFAVTVLQGPGSDCKLQVFLYITVFTFFLLGSRGRLQLSRRGEIVVLGDTHQ